LLLVSFFTDRIRRSARIADASYRPRTTWHLPEIVSGVPPSGFGNRERRDEGDMDVDSGKSYVFGIITSFSNQSDSAEQRPIMNFAPAIDGSTTHGELFFFFLRVELELSFLLNKKRGWCSTASPSTHRDIISSTIDARVHRKFRLMSFYNLSFIPDPNPPVRSTGMR
jgi:hypothetical protein